MVDVHKCVRDHTETRRFKNGCNIAAFRDGKRQEKELGGCISTQSCRSLLKADIWSGSAPLQMFNVDKHVDIGPLFTVWSRLHPQAEAIMGAWGRDQDTSEY